MKSTIRQRAAELGFDDCRFTTAAAPASAEEFRRWLAQKNQGEMSWLERSGEKRTDPQKVLPGAKTVIVLAASYEISEEPERRAPVGLEGRNSGLEMSRIGGRHSDAVVQGPTTHPILKVEASSAGRGQDVPTDGVVEPADRRVRAPLAPTDRPIGASMAAPTPPTGIVARYARFADYHAVLGGRLKSLTEFINQVGGAQTRSLWYVDTGPLLERDLAQRAGLGFVGKHTNLISRRLGNWILLAEILTTLELEPDAPEQNHCGKCVRCIAACPTRAITSPFQLDARKCISYLTIELKGAIPVELRPAIGNRIFGCDDCLAVCPWNKFARAGRLMRPHGRADLRQPDLLEWLQLDEAGFKAKFAGTPLWRTKRRGLLRNVCVALGNLGDASALPALEHAAGGPEPLIAEHAHWAMEQIRNRLRFLEI